MEEKEETKDKTFCEINLDMEKVVDYFKKFYGMKPYLSIDEKEWQYIITTYEKDELVDELIKCLHTYPCPIPEITEKETLRSLNKLKSVQWMDILEYKSWFPRNERRSKYELTNSYFKRDNSGNNVS